MLIIGCDFHTRYQQIADVPAILVADYKISATYGKERDAETGNDDFGARYYSNRFGRWLSADWSNVPAPVPYAHLTNPQTHKPSTSTPWSPMIPNPSPTSMATLQFVTAKS